MIKPVLTSDINSDNVNLAILENETTSAKNNIEIVNLSESVAENVLTSIDKTNITSVMLETGLISFNTISNNILITNDCIIDEFDLYPLWYKCSIQNRVYNETAVVRSVIKSISNNSPIITTLVESISDRVVSGSISISKIVGSNSIPIPETDFVFNKANNSIYLLPECFSGVSKISVTVDYFVVKQNVFIELENTQINSNQYVVDYKFSKPSVTVSNFATLNKSEKQTFIVTIYSNVCNNDFAMYTFKYKAVIGATIIDKTELLKTVPSFIKTNTTPLEQMYRQVGSSIFVNYRYLSERYYVKLININNEVISIMQPNSYKSEPWYLQIIQNGTDPNFTVHEYRKFKIIEGKKINNVINESSQIVVPYGIKLRNGNVYPIYDKDGYIKNISIYINGNQIESSEINDIDLITGYISITRQLKKTDVILTSYTYTSEAIPYEYLQLNPIQNFVSSVNPNKYRYLVFIVNNGLLNPDKNRSVFHFDMKKFVTFVTIINKYEFDTTAAIAYIENNLATVIGSEYYQANPNITTNKIRALGLVTTINSSTASSINYLDTRVRGGGLPEDIIIKDYIQEYPLTEYNADIVYLDGSPYPSNNVYVIKMPEYYVTNMTNRLRLYDKEVIAAIVKDNDSNNLAYTKARATVETAIKRFLPAAAYTIIEYV